MFNTVVRYHKMATHILFYVVAKDCPACKVFAKNWELLRAVLKKTHGDKLEIDTIEYERRLSSSLDLSKYPLDLVRFIHWYPAFILIPRTAYLDVKEKGRGELPAVVFNGRMPAEPGARIVPATGKDRQALNIQTVQAWVDREMATPLPAVNAVPTTAPVLSAPLTSTERPLYSSPQPSAALPSPSSTPTVLSTDDHEVCGRLKLVSRFVRAAQ